MSTEGPGEKTFGDPNPEGLEHVPPNERAEGANREEIENFVRRLREKKEDLIKEISQLFDRVASPDEMALAIYLDVTLRQSVFGMDPFVSASSTESEIQQNRLAIAVDATEHVANHWLQHHPSSLNARVVSRLTLMAPTASQVALLSEMWSSLPINDPTLHG
jgi:hypothetical protein